MYAVAYVSKLKSTIKISRQMPHKRGNKVSKACVCIGLRFKASIKIKIQGKCIRRSAECQSENICHLKQDEIDEVGRCPDLECSASDCEKCVGGTSTSCTWTRSVQRLGDQVSLQQH